jgi:hypothetical protein
MNEAKRLDSTIARAVHPPHAPAEPLPAISRPRRRGLLTGTIAALLTGAAAVATANAAPLLTTAGDDAELIRLCGDFHRLTAAMAAWSVDDDDGFDAKMSERWAVSDRIMLLSATTDTGRRQKAAVALVGLEENYKPSEGQTIRTTLAALRDIAGTAVAAAARAACLLPAAASDDAELLSACEVFWRHERHIVVIDTRPLEDFHTYGTTECEAEERETGDALDAWNDSVETITDLAPSTRAGVLAKVTVSRAALCRHVAGTTQDFHAKSSREEDLILSVFDDILGDGSAVA